MDQPKLKKYWRFFQDLLFPIYCLDCQTEGQDWLCPRCLARIKRWSGRASLSGDYLDQIVIAADYGNPVIRQAIHLLKYQFISDLAYPLGKILVEPASRWSSQWVFVPIPLHRFRHRWRDFNQVELILRQASEAINLDVRTDILLKTKNTRPQMSLNKAEREVNILDAFTVNKTSLGKIENIILVDDVVTTGQTLNQAAKVLKQAGVRRVEGLVLAHG
ncbi:MAG: ComF family protein [Patescibacteria group bacterium]